MEELGSVGPYRLVRELGRGGQGTVYLAQDERLGRAVALKVLTGIGAASEETLRRFRREAEVASRLDHPGIATIYDTGLANGTPYIAMRYVEGESLARRIAAAREQAGASPEEPATEPDPAGGELPSTRDDVLRVVRLIEGAARAVHAAHEAGVIHRDLKPGNIVVTPQGLPVILDFGLARDLGGDAPSLTVSGEIHGTPVYMSPEQIRSRGAPVDRRTDVYSLGVTLYEALTLRRPFDAPTREGLYHAILTEDPHDPRRLNPAIPSDLKVVLETAMEKDRDRRYRNALELAEELRRVREYEPIHARPAGLLLRFGRWAQRNPFLASSTIGLIVLLVVGCAISTLLWRRVSRERDAKDGALREKAEMLERSEGLRLTAQSSEALPANPALALLLALEGARRQAGQLAHDAVLAALGRCHELRTLTGAEGPVTAGAFAPDGRRALTVSADGRARLWDLEAVGTVLWSTGGTPDPIAAAAFTPDGSKVVTASGRDGVVRVWEAENGRPVREMTGHAGPVLALCLSADGRRVATASEDGSARVWELADGRSVSVLETGTPLGLVAFSPDGRRLLAAGAPIAKLSRTLPPSRILGSQVARVWELETGKELLAVRGSRYAAFSPDGRRVALAGPLQYARIVDLARGREVGVLKVFQGEAVAVAFSGQGDKVLAFTTEKAVHVWDAFTGQELTSVRSGVEPFTSASFDPEGRRVLATSEDGTARLFDAESGKEVLALRGHTGPVRDARFDATGARLLTVSDDRTARVWEPTAALDRLVPRMTGGRLNALIPAGFAPLAAVSPDGRRLLTRTLLESSIWAWDLEKRARMASWRAPVQPYVTAFGPDSRFAAFATAEGFVRVVDLRSGAVHAQYQQGTGRWVEALAVAPGGDLIVLVTRPIVRRRQQPERALQAELVGVKGVRPPVVLKHEDAVRGAAFDGLGRSVVTWSDDRVVAVWDGVTGELRCRLTGHDGPVTGAVLSPDGASVLTTSADRTARLWGVPDGQPRELLRGFEDAVLGAAFAPDGRRAVAWSKDHTALLWELGKPGDAVTLRGHEKPVVAGAFSPDGRRLVTGSEDHTARVWAADTGAPWSTYRGHDQALRAAVFGPDGREVVTVSLDSVVRLWPIDLLRAAQAFCPRELTPLERARYEVKERY